MWLSKFLEKLLIKNMVTSVPSKIGKDGYAVVDIEGTSCYVHDIIAKSFVPNPEGKKYVIHKDGNKLNNHASNLAWSDVPEQ